MGCQQMTVLSRSIERARSVAEKLSAEAGAFDDLADRLADADLVICSSASREPLIDAALLDVARGTDAERPLVIFDVAVPRDVAPAVGRRRQVHLYNIDDLQELASAALSKRRQALEACYTIVDRHVAEFLADLARRGVGPVISALTGRLEATGRGEIDWLLPKLTGSPARDRQLIEQFVHRVVSKIMHAPTEQLGQRARTGAVELYAEALRKLFDLPPE
jgi:glutamyl-tRNA reductase